jgi:hypothetical protein
MGTTINLIWHRLWPNAPAERRAVAPWKLTGLDGSPVYGRVQFQDGNWQGQVIVNSLPADWRKNRRANSYPSEWHQKRHLAIASVEAFLANNAPTLFNVDEITFMTWDDEEPAPEPVKIVGKEAKLLVIDDVPRTPLTDRLKADAQKELTRIERRMLDSLAADVLKHDFEKWAKVNPPKALTSLENEMLKKYWG